VKGNIYTFFVRYMLLKFGQRKVGRKSSGFWITLPKLWCITNNITAGDFVEMEMTEKGLLLITVNEDAQD